MIIKRLMVQSCLLLLLAISNSIIADEQHEAEITLPTSDSKPADQADLQRQQIVDEFKAYAATVSESVRNEVVAYRQKIHAINKQKREEYRKLSQEAQQYLTREQQFKKRLPLKGKPKNAGQQLKQTQSQQQ